MDSLLQDLRYAARSLTRSPSFFAVAALTLGLGIGANTAIFTGVNAILLRPLPYAAAEGLVAVFMAEEARGSDRAPTSPAAFRVWQDESATLRDLTPASPWSPVLRRDGERPLRLEGLMSGARLFELLGAKAAHGRTFASGDEQVVVLGHELFERQFGGDESVVGRTLSLDGEPHTVIGVMPAGFQFPPFWHRDAEIWRPFAAETLDPTRHARFLRVFARLAPGTELARARAELRAIGDRLAATRPDHYQATSAGVEALREPVVEDVRGALLVLLGAVGFVLLLASANVANLVLVRADGRRRELALRIALGAGRGRLLRLLAIESLLLALAGAAVGLALGSWALEALLALAPSDLPRLGEISLDGRVLAFTLGAALLAALVCGLVPARTALRADLRPALGSGGRSTAGPGRRALRGALVAGEVALALMLLAGAGLALKSLWRLVELDPGFDAEKVLAASMSLSGTAHEEPAAQPAFFAELESELRALPGVAAVGLINHLPIGGDLWGLPFVAADRDITTAAGAPVASYRVVSDGYFAAMGITLERGRTFTPADGADARPSVVVNRTLAQRTWPGEAAVGRQLKAGGPDSESPWLTVVGVVEDVRQWRLSDEVRSEIYFPYAQNPVAWYAQTSVVVRAAGTPGSLAGAVRDRIASVGPDVAVFGVGPLDALLRRSLAATRFHGTLLTSFAAVALGLAAIGIYAVLAFAVGSRRGEIGVRLALGARRSQIFGQVLGQSLTRVLLGLALGLLAAVLLGRLAGSLLVEVSALDPAVLGGVALLLLAVAALASALPAWRATRIDPAISLRAD